MPNAGCLNSLDARTDCSIWARRAISSQQMTTLALAFSRVRPIRYRLKKVPGRPRSSPSRCSTSLGRMSFSYVILISPRGNHTFLFNRLHRSVVISLLKHSSGIAGDGGRLASCVGPKDCALKKKRLMENEVTLIFFVSTTSPFVIAVSVSVDVMVSPTRTVEGRYENLDLNNASPSDKNDGRTRTRFWRPLL